MSELKYNFASLLDFWKIKKNDLSGLFLRFFKLQYLSHHLQQMEHHQLDSAGIVLEEQR